MAEPQAGAAGTLPPLWRQREYMLLWSAQVVSGMGSQAAGIVVPLLILAMTQSPAAVGLAGAIAITPYILLSLPVGALIDRWDRRRVMICCDLGRALTAASVALALWFDALTLGHLYAVAALQGTLLVFFNIAEVAALPRLVATAQLPQAVSQNQAGGASAAIAGPALGSWLFQHLGRAFPFVVNMASFAASASAIWQLRTPLAARSASPAGVSRNLRAEMAVGLRWLWGEPVVRSMAVLTCIGSFVGSALPLLLIVLAKSQGAGEAQIGLVFSAAGVGALLGSLAGGWVARRLSFGAVIAGTLALQALLLPLLLLAPRPWALAAVYGLFMFFGPIYNVVQFSHRLAMIPDGLQGRVNSAYRLMANLLIPVGAGLCGVLIERWGALPTLAMFAAVLVGLAVAAAANPAVRGAVPIRPLA